MNACDETICHGGILTIDLNALQHNYRILSARAKPVVTSAVVKADAYGLGCAHVAPALYREGCRIFFVAQLVEAFRLKPHLPPDAMIAILNGVNPGAEIMAVEAGFTPVLNSFDAISRFSALCRTTKRSWPAMIQLDVGMNRLGLDAQDLAHLQQNPEIFSLADIRFIIGHLSHGDEMAAANTKALTRFKQAVQCLPKRKMALANSGGIFQGEGFLFDMVRPGIGLYGAEPIIGLKTDLKPVITLEAIVLQTRHVEKGDAVGYGGTFTMPHSGTITTIAVGYADGWNRSLSNKGAAFFNGEKAPIIGRISMDSIIVDTTALSRPPQPGERAELIGPHQSLEKVAQDAGTITYEILTSLGRRYKRHYLH